MERREASGLCAKSPLPRPQTRPWLDAPIGAPPPFVLWGGQWNGFRGLAWHSSGAIASRERFRFSPPAHARSAWWGGVRGGGTLTIRAPHPGSSRCRALRRPSPPLRGGRGIKKRIAGRDEVRTPQIRRTHLPKRNYPGRRNLLGSWRHCTNKRCRRVRSCSGDSWTCVERAWKWTKKRPKTLRKAYARIGNLPDA